MATLGAVLIRPDSLDIIVSIVRPSDFYRKTHALIFEAMLYLNNQSREVDVLTLTDYFESRKLLNGIGGISFLTSLSTHVPISANVEHYANIVKENSLRRQLIQISYENIEDSYNASVSLGTVLEDAERRIFQVAESKQSVSFQSAGDVVNDTFSLIEDRYQRKDHYTGIPTGIRELDNMLSGFQDSEFIVLGARPSVGKTALAVTMATNIAIHKTIPVGFFTLEMSAVALIQRFISSEGRVSSQKLRNGMMNMGDFKAVTAAASRIYDAPLWISDSPGMKLLDLRAQARRMCSKHAVRVIFIDYISLIGTEDSNIPRHEQIAETSRSLKALARELAIPVIVLSQLTRDTEGKRPVLANIRESGAIEQDADVVLFLHRERESFKDWQDSGNEVIETELIVAKQRNGPVGTIRIAFIPKYARFEELLAKEA